MISILNRNPDLLFGKDHIHGIIIPDYSNIVSSKEKNIGNHNAIGIGHGLSLLCDDYNITEDDGPFYYERCRYYLCQYREIFVELQ